MSGDFTSARFLGFGIPAGAGVPNLGKPAVLVEPPGSAAVALRVAASQGAADGLVARSVLHGLIDVLSSQPRDVLVLVDEHAYPVSRWAAHAVKKGADVLTYRHHDARHARRLLHGHHRAAVVLADAWCSGCLQAAPLAELAQLAGAVGGRLMVDDSLAFGVLGPDGCGSPGWAGVPHAGLLWVASAAKAYGATLAVVTGPHRQLARIRELGPNRMHSSPAPGSEIARLAAALDDPHLVARRDRLAANTARLRRGLASLGLPTLGGPLPIVAIDVGDTLGSALHSRLRRSGVDTLLVRSACRGGSRPTLCVRADHTADQLDEAVEAVREVVGWAA